MSTKYLFITVPSNITPSGHKDDAISALQKSANPSNGEVLSLSIPEFKVGTLDALLQQSDELGKLTGVCNSIVTKVGETLKNVLDGDEEKIAQHKNVNDSELPALLSCRRNDFNRRQPAQQADRAPEPLEQYLRSFSWNKVKYRADRPLAELIDLLQKVKKLARPRKAFKSGMEQETA